MLKSSSYREAMSSGKQRSTKKSTGCMSGLFHFLSRHYHSHSRKRLASAGKREKPDNSPVKPTPPTDKRSPPLENNEDRKELKRDTAPEEPTLAVELRRHSCDAPRSPTLPPEIRRSCSAGTPCSPRQPPALVARLMGLEEVAPDTNSPESAAEKRRKLLGALEKCDEDLKELKRIIDAVGLAETHRKSVAVAEEGSKQSKVDDMAASRACKKGFETMEVKNGSEFSCEQQPSPVSVLDVVSSPRSCSSQSEKVRQREDQIAAVPSRNFDPLPQRAFFLGNHCKRSRDASETSSLYHTYDAERGAASGSRYNEGKLLEQFGLARRRTECSGRRCRPGTRSEAMVESVEEVWEDGVWEETWELGRVRVGLEVDIFGDLVEEVVMELLGYCYKLSLLLGTCRKRLCF